MDPIRQHHTSGRRLMIDAFVKVSDRARRAGVDEGWISEMHGQFFDGNVQVKSSFGASVLLRLVDAQAASLESQPPLPPEQGSPGPEPER